MLFLTACKRFVRILLPDSWVNTLWHLPIACVAAYWYGFPSRRLTIIGVTGTDGKTTTVNLIYHIFKTAGYKVSMISTVKAVIGTTEYPLGFHVTSPHPFEVQRLYAQALAAGSTHIVVEVTSHALAQNRFFGSRFTVGVLTNITHEHLDYHGTYREYALTKLKLLYRSQIAVLNSDDNSFSLFHPLPHQKVVTYGQSRADFTPRKFTFKSTLIGSFNRYNQLAAIACTRTLGISKEKIRKALATFPGVIGRLEVVYDKEFQVIVDFAHTPNSFEQILSTLRPKVNKRLIHVFGCAGLRDETKRPLMGKISARFADLIVLTEEDYRIENIEAIMSEIEKGIAGKVPVVRILNRQEAISYAINQAQSGDCVVTTGKAHEKSLCRGTIEHPWDEFEAVKQALKQRYGK